VRTHRACAALFSGVSAAAPAQHSAALEPLIKSHATEGPSDGGGMSPLGGWGAYAARAGARPTRPRDAPPVRRGAASTNAGLACTRSMAAARLR
jgi:hypothetical protein